MNTFENLYNDYLAWKAKRFVGLVGLIVVGAVAIGWWVGLSRYMEYLQLDGPQAVELHAFDGHEFGKDHATSVLRYCKALINPKTGKSSFYVYSNEPSARPDVGIGTASSYCGRVLGGAKDWIKYQTSYSMGMGERIFWFVLFGVAGLLGLAGALLFVGIIDVLLSFVKIPSVSVLLSMPIVFWFLFSFIVFMYAGYDERRDSWSTSKGSVEVTRLWVTDDGRVLKRPTHLLDWAWGETLSDRSSSIPKELLQDFMGVQDAK